MPMKSVKHIRKYRNEDQKQIWGLCKNKYGVCRSMFALNLGSGKGQQLRRIILLQIGLVTFNVHFPKRIGQCAFFLILGNVHDLEAHDSGIWIHRSIQINSKIIQHHVGQ